MSLVRSTGNGTSNLIANLEERKRSMQRKNADNAYRKQIEYFLPKAPTLAELEDLLLGNKEREPENPEVNAAVREYQQIEQAQNRLQDSKGLGVPVQTIVGTTPEMTIELLEKVRNSTLAESVPTEKDLHVAARASDKIQKTLSRVMLNAGATKQIEVELKRQVEDEAGVSSRSVPSDFQSPVAKEDLENLQKKRLKEQAIAKYSYQVHLKRYGFAQQQPSFFRIA